MKKKNQISTVSIIGSGNVATALAIALSNYDVKIVEIFSPNIKHSKLLADKVNCDIVHNIEELNQNSDIYIVATPDKEIKNVSSNLGFVTGIIAHTSGSEPISIFEKDADNYGVFYPLQTFTVGKKVNLEKVPICIEGNDEATTNKLAQLAGLISNNVVILTTEQRQYLHLTAVTVNNFTNWLHHNAYDVLVDNNIDFTLLHPLIKETARKIDVVSPGIAQTGPARRNDVATINKHIELLSQYPEFKELYSLLSNQIINKYHDKL